MDSKLLFYAILFCLEVVKGNDQKNRVSREILIVNRQKRDGYGCACGYNGCNEKHEKLLYFGSGVVLGLLLSYYVTNSTTGRGLSHRYLTRHYNPGVMSNLQQLPINELATFALDLLQIYYGRDEIPNCTHRWVCEVTKNALKEGNIENAVSIFNVLSSWIPIGIIQNRIRDFTSFGGLQWINCRILSPDCKEAFVRQ